MPELELDASWHGLWELPAENAQCQRVTPSGSGPTWQARCRRAPWLYWAS